MYLQAPLGIRHGPLAAAQYVETRRNRIVKKALTPIRESSITKSVPRGLMSSFASETRSGLGALSRQVNRKNSLARAKEIGPIFEVSLDRLESSGVLIRNGLKNPVRGTKGDATRQDAESSHRNGVRHCVGS
jgi:hypothetical protein